MIRGTTDNKPFTIHHQETRPFEVRSDALSEDAVEDYIRTLRYSHPYRWASIDVEAIVAGNIRNFAAKLREASNDKAKF